MGNCTGSVKKICISRTMGYCASAVAHSAGFVSVLRANAQSWVMCWAVAQHLVESNPGFSFPCTWAKALDLVFALRAIAPNPIIC
jgi:hypothetical protein